MKLHLQSEPLLQPCNMAKAGNNSNNTTLRKFIRFYFRALAILMIDLIVSAINNQVITLSEYVKKPVVTVIGMVVILILFWFLLKYIDRITVNVLKVTIEFGANLRFKKTAMFVIMTIVLVVLFILYYYTWFQEWPSWRMRWM